jgi:hypothetical protein
MALTIEQAKFAIEFPAVSKEMQKIISGFLECRTRNEKFCF